MTEPPISGHLRFDPVLTWGNLLVFIGIIVSAIGVYVGGEVRATRVDGRVAALESAAATAARTYEKMDDKLNSISIDVSAIKATLPPAPRTNFPSR